MEHRIPITDNYILIFDVLGFKNLINSNDLTEIFNKYALMITGTSFAGNIIGRNAFEIMVYSDTVALKCNSADKTECLVSLIRIAHSRQYVQLYKSIGNDKMLIPIRGALSFGEYIFHKGDIYTQAPARTKIEAKDVNIIIGKAIISAHELEQEMQIMTIALTDDAQKKAPPSVLDDLCDKNLIIKYDIPLKDRKTKKTFTSEKYIVNPLSKTHHEIIMGRLKEERDKYKDESDVFCKYKNTIELFEYIKKNNLFYPKIPQ